MKVLLRESIDKLGERGEIVEVANGYARNYLLPRGLGVRATPGNFRLLEVERNRIAKKIAGERAEMGEAQERLESTSCTVVAAASPEGHLYGSVGAKEIAAGLAEGGLRVDPHQVRLEHPFKEIGVYVVDVELAEGLVATTRVWIVAES